MYGYGARFYMPDVARLGVVDPLAEIYRRWSTYRYGVDNPIKFFDPDGRGVLTDYYNLFGQQTKHVDDGKTDKKIALTINKKEADTDAAIASGNVVNQINNDQLKQIDEIYAFGKTDKTGTEKGFYFGQNGNSSKTDNEGNVAVVGSPKPSPDTDVQPQNMKGDTQPSMIFGWTENENPKPAGQVGGATTYNHTPTVGFYNSSGSIITVDYSKFKKGMEKVNK